jgi:hypothetical protein
LTREAITELEVNLSQYGLVFLNDLMTKKIYIYLTLINKFKD